MPRVHTPCDKDFSPEKTARLIDGLADFLQSKLSDHPVSKEAPNPAELQR